MHMMKTNVKEIKRKCPFSEKYSRDQTAGKKTQKKTICCWASRLPTGKVTLIPPGLGETQILVRGRQRVTVLFHLAETVVCDPPQ